MSDDVSVVIPVRDGAAFLGEAIASALAQSHPPLECIVVDDGSRDASAQVAAGFDGVRVIASAGEGAAAARNRGARAARGTLIAFLDADDRWLPQRLERGLEALRDAHSDAGLCASRVFGERSPVGTTLRLHPAAPTVDDLLSWRGTVVPLGSNLLIEGAAFEAVGGFTAGLVHVEDWELLVRLVERGPIAYVDEPLVEYRWHAVNQTRELDTLERGLRRAYEIVLAGRQYSRRRAHAGMHRMLAAAHWRLGSRSRAATHALRSAALDPVAAVGYVAGGRRPR